MAKCPKCGAEVEKPTKTWVLTPKSREPVTIGLYKCPKGHSFRAGVKEEGEKDTTKEERVEEKDWSKTIFIGRKPLMSYALAALLQFNAGHDEVVIKARGRAISKAVDVAEIIRRRLYADQVDISNIKIGTEILGEDMRNVSTIEIVLIKK